MALGFNRLSINGVGSGGAQPFQYKHWVCMVNGEIYNDKELREKHGLDLSSESDCVVVAPLFDKYGADMVASLDGFFSGVILDTKTGRTFTIRDKMRKKPLFLGVSKQELFLTSELKALDDIGGFHSISSGCCEINWMEHRFSQCYNYPEEHEFSQEPSLAPHLLQEHMEKAVVKRLPDKTQPLAVFLSGGLDSSIIASIVHKHREDAVYVCVSAKGEDDYHYAKQLEQALKLEHVVYLDIAGEDIGSRIKQVVCATESFNPSIISNGIGTYIVAEYVHQQGIKVALSGEGADELFGGYHSFQKDEGWKQKQQQLMLDMHFTELRRIDLCGMAQSVEIRCPFLDKEMQRLAENAQFSDLYSREGGDCINKAILRKAFESVLPSDIVYRKKVSFDVGSGFRARVKRYLHDYFPRKSEREALKVIWETEVKYAHLSSESYFSAYPAFDDLIDRRGDKHSG